MSYDVDIAGESFNYTSNVSGLFYDHIPAERSRGGLHELQGLTGAQAVPILAEAFKLIRSYDCQFSDFAAKYDAPNGWGTTMGGLIFLANILAACAKYPRHKVSVDA